MFGLQSLAFKAIRKIARYVVARYGGKRVAPYALERLVLERFYDTNVGKDYHVDQKAKTKLIDRFRVTVRQIQSGTSWLYHVVLATEILNIPPSEKGNVVECGSYKGASTANLSLVCEKVGRRLIVCDSFEGLPDDEDQVVHQYPHLQVYGYYEKGMYTGRLEEVKENISRYGAISVCQFVPGFFSNSLKTLTEPLVFAFLDVDLTTSMRDCVKYIWPLMIDGGIVYTDDSCDMEMVRIWFDDDWWQHEVGVRAPGYIGSGCGLPLSPTYSSLGYTRKVQNPELVYERVPWLYYP